MIWSCSLHNPNYRQLMYFKSTKISILVKLFYYLTDQHIAHTAVISTINHMLQHPISLNLQVITVLVTIVIIALKFLIHFCLKSVSMTQIHETRRRYPHTIFGSCASVENEME